MELIPRISRAQSMDALSSQALVAGYRAAIVAAERLPRFFPLNMTAAGTVPPAQVLVLGAGVAGLQAIATCKRLGAVVKAYDVRTAAAEEIASMGAVPIELELGTLDGPGGYAREMTAERAQLQRELLTPYVAAADALITTAAVPGRTAPMLVSRSMVEQMKPGSVVVDLASEQGGNVEGSVAGTELTIGDALVWGGANVPSQMAGPASRLYGQNITNLIRLMTRNAAFDPDFDDEIVRGCCVTHDGSVLHEPTRELLEGSGMTESIALLTIFVLAAFVGVEVISKVSSTLHTPLMSGANAIHGVILVGAIIVTGQAESAIVVVVGLLAVVLATVNMVGGFVVTDRMLEMFRGPGARKKELHK